MRYQTRHKRRKLLPILLIILVVVAGLMWFKQKDSKAPSANSQNAEQQSNKDQAEQKASLPVIDLQPTADAWANKQSGEVGLYIIDLDNNKVVAEINPDQQFFTASIYKIYVAYEGYRKVADGTYGFDQNYLGSYTRGKCLDLMIRESYSPCAEKMWAELGKEKLTAKLKTYDIDNTNMTGLRTTARDAALLLQRLFERKELTQEHTQYYLDSMKTQDAKFRRGLPTGFTNATVYNKVGWNENIEWHDTAIVNVGGRNYVISLLTERVGTTQIKELARALEAKINQ